MTIFHVSQLGTFKVDYVHVQSGDYLACFLSHSNRSWMEFLHCHFSSENTLLGEQVRNYLNKQEEEDATGAMRSCQDGSGSTLSRQNQRFSPKVVASSLRVRHSTERLWQRDSLDAERNMGSPEFKLCRAVWY